MGAGLVVTIGGKLDASYPATLEKALATSNATALKMRQQSIQQGIIKQQVIIAGLSSADAAQAIGRSKFVQQEQLKLRLLQSATERALNKADVESRIKADAEKIAADKAAALAQAAIIARGFGSAAAIRGGHGHGQSPAGVVSEVAVIGHEIVQGRGTGRILGSISILGQRLGWLRKIIKTTADVDVDAAATMGKLSQAASAEALVLEEKAVATTVANGATIQEVEEAQKAAAASLEHSAAIEKETATLVEKAEISRATATIEKGSIGTIVGGAILIIAVIALLIAAYRGLKSILKDKADAEKYAANTSLEHTLSMKDELDAMEKLSDAMDKTKRALEEMNEAKDDMVEKTHEAIKAMEDEAKARDELNDVKTHGDLLDIDIAEKQGKISHTDAIKAKASVEMNAAAEKALNKQKDLQDKKSALVVAASDAETLAGIAQNNAYLAADKLNLSPQGRQNALDLVESEKQRDADLKAAEDARKEAANQYGTGILGSDDEKSRQQILDRATQAEAGASVMDAIVSSIKSNMKPDEISAAETLKDAGEKNDAWKKLKMELDQAQSALDAYNKTFLPVLKANQDNIKKQEKIDLFGQDKGPQNLNAMQKLGAFTAQGGNPLIELQKTNNARAAQLVILAQQQVDTQRAWLAHIKNQQGGVRH